MLLGRAPFESPTSTNLDPDLVKERKDAEAWVRVKFNLPAETDLTGPGPLAQDPRFVRGTELWELGMYDEARVEFEWLRESISTDPVASFRLRQSFAGDRTVSFRDLCRASGINPSRPGWSIRLTHRTGLLQSFALRIVLSRSDH